MRPLVELNPWQRMALLLAVCTVAAAVLLAAREGPGPVVPTSVVEGVEPARGEADGFVDVAEGDPLAFEPSRADEFLERGGDGLAHVLYELSPGGVEATAERVDRFGPEIRSAAAAADVDPATLEALVFLESAGRPNVIAGTDPEAASGLGQILPETATSLLDMSVDLERSRALTAEIARQEGRLREAGGADERRRAEERLEDLLAERAEADERFDPEAALAGAARYLALAEDHFGRADLGAVSYHMGIGNLDDVIKTYLAPQRVEDTTRATVERHELTYAQLYFDSTPAHNPRTHDLLRNELGDDSRHYLFKLESAREIMRLFRADPDELARLVELHGAKASAEEVLRPPGETERFEGAEALRGAYRDGDLVALPDRPDELGFRVAPGMGELSGELDLPAATYRGLRPQALATVVYLSRQVREITGEGTTLTLTSTVRDQPYQELLQESNVQATDGYSLHTTGYSFDIRLDLSDREETAVESVLERMRALNVVAYVHEPGAIHVTVGPAAAELVADSGPL